MANLTPHDVTIVSETAGSHTFPKPADGNAARADTVEQKRVHVGSSMEKLPVVSAPEFPSGGRAVPHLLGPVRE